MNKWIKRCGVYIYTMEYNSALKKKKILTYAIPWRSLGDIILSKVNQLCNHMFDSNNMEPLGSQTDRDAK